MTASELKRQCYEKVKSINPAIKYKSFMKELVLVRKVGKLLPDGFMFETNEITLCDVKLGKFIVHVTIDGDDVLFRGVAITPNISISGYNHPHISSSDDEICLGDYDQIIHKNVLEGNWLLVIDYICSVLNTYNPDSMYDDIEKWYGVECENCGDINEGMEATCVKCDGPMCSSCRSSSSYMHIGCRRRDYERV